MAKTTNKSARYKKKSKPTPRRGARRQLRAERLEPRRLLAGDHGPQPVLALGFEGTGIQAIADQHGHQVARFANTLTDQNYGNGSAFVSAGQADMTIDLGQIKAFDRLRIGQDRLGQFNERPLQDLSVEVSADGFHFFRIYQTDSLDGELGQAPAPGATIQIAFAPTQGRFVRVRSTAASNRIDEIEIYSGSPDASPTTPGASLVSTWPFDPARRHAADVPQDAHLFPVQPFDSPANLAAGAVVTVTAPLNHFGHRIDGPINRTSGRFGGAIDLAAADDRVVVPSTPGLDSIGAGGSDFTMALWVRPRETSSGTFRELITKGDVNRRGPLVSLRPDSNRLHVRVSTTHDFNEGFDTVGILPVNQWSHVAVVHRAGQLSVFIDGQLDSQTQLVGQSVGNQGPLTIGALQSSGSIAAIASVDEVQLFDEALDAGAVAYHANHAITAPVHPVVRPVLSLGFEESGAQEILDQHDRPVARFANTLTDQNYGNGSAFVSAGEADMTIDLGQIKAFDRLRIGQDRLGQFGERSLQNLTIEVSSDDVNYATVYHSNSLVDELGQSLAAADTLQIAFAPTQSRFVRVRSTAASNRIDEIEIYSGSPDASTDSLGASLVSTWPFDPARRHAADVPQDAHFFPVQPFDSPANLAAGAVVTVTAPLNHFGHRIDGPIHRTSGRFGGAIDLAATDDRVVVPSTPGLDSIGAGGSDFTMALWVRPRETSSGTFRELITKGDVNRRGPLVSLRPDSNRLHVRVSTTHDFNEGLDTVAALPAYRWSHVAVVHRAGQLSVFIDGQLDSQTQLVGQSVGNQGSLTIGALRSSGSIAAIASVDEVQIFGEALDQPAVSFYANSGIVRGTPPSTPPILAMPFEGTDPDTLGDSVDRPVADGDFHRTPGRYGNAIGLPANGARIELPKTPGLNNLGADNGDYTLAFWYRPNSARQPDWRRIIGKDGVDTDRGPAVFIAPNTNRLHIPIAMQQGWTSVNTTTDFEIGRWSHVAIVKAGDTISVSVDGVREATQVLASPSIAADGHLTIGGAATAFSIDEFQVFDYALSDSAVAYFATAPLDRDLPPASAPVITLPFESGDPQTLHDRVGQPVADGDFNRVDGPFGRAIQLPATGSPIHLPGLSDLGAGDGDYAIAFWYRPDTDPKPHFQRIMSKSGTNTDRAPAVFIAPNTNRLHIPIQLQSGWTSVNTVTDFQVGQWSHVAIVKAGSELSVSVDGVREATQGLSSPTIAADGPFSIGGAGTAFSIDEFQVFDHTLGQSAIAYYATAPIQRSRLDTSTSLVKNRRRVDALLATSLDNLAGGIVRDLDGKSITVGSNISEASTIPGRFGNALRLTDPQQSIELTPLHSRSNPFIARYTFSFWVRPDQAPSAGFRSIITRGGRQGGVEPMVGFAPGTNRLQVILTDVRGNQNASPVTRDLEVGQWSQVTLVRDGFTLSLYLDGQLSFASEVSFNSGYDSRDLTLGQYGDYDAAAVSLDELQYHVGALKELELQYLAANKVGPFLSATRRLLSDDHRRLGNPTALTLVSDPSVLTSSTDGRSFSYVAAIGNETSTTIEVKNPHNDFLIFHENDLLPPDINDDGTWVIGQAAQEISVAKDEDHPLTPSDFHLTGFDPDSSGIVLLKSLRGTLSLDGVAVQPGAELSHQQLSTGRVTYRSDPTDEPTATGYIQIRQKLRGMTTAKPINFHVYVAPSPAPLPVQTEEELPVDLNLKLLDVVVPDQSRSQISFDRIPQGGSIWIDNNPVGAHQRFDHQDFDVRDIEYRPAEGQQNVGVHELPFTVWADHFSRPVAHATLQIEVVDVPTVGLWSLDVRDSANQPVHDVHVGDTFRVDVIATANDNLGFRGGALELQYDSDVLEFAGGSIDPRFNKLPHRPRPGIDVIRGISNFSYETYGPRETFSTLWFYVKREGEPAFELTPPREWDRDLFISGNEDGYHLGHVEYLGWDLTAHPRDNGSSSSSKASASMGPQPLANQNQPAADDVGKPAAQNNEPPPMEQEQEPDPEQAAKQRRSRFVTGDFTTEDQSFDTTWNVATEPNKIFRTVVDRLDEPFSQRDIASFEIEPVEPPNGVHGSIVATPYLRITGMPKAFWTLENLDDSSAEPTVEGTLADEYFEGPFDAFGRFFVSRAADRFESYRNETLTVELVYRNPDGPLSDVDGNLYSTTPPQSGRFNRSRGLCNDHHQRPAGANQPRADQASQRNPRHRGPHGPARVAPGGTKQSGAVRGDSLDDRSRHS